MTLKHQVRLLNVFGNALLALLPCLGVLAVYGYFVLTRGLQHVHVQWTDLNLLGCNVAGLVYLVLALGIVAVERFQTLTLRALKTKSVVLMVWCYAWSWVPELTFPLLIVSVFLVTIVLDVLSAHKPPVGGR